LIEFLGEGKVPSDFGLYRMLLFREIKENKTHIVVILGTPELHETPIVRVHSACITGEVFNANNCDCKAQLDFAFSTFLESGGGVLIYLDQEGRGNGLAAKLKTMEMILAGESPHRAFEKLGYPGDARTYDVVAEILKWLGIYRPIALLTNNPQKMAQLQNAGVRIAVRRECFIVPRTKPMQVDLESKRDDLGHYLPNSILVTPKKG
jgi:3,4-dihydroxy 2-butanone 4-phosphate synthase/GTP cyclohydrolase II